SRLGPTMAAAQKTILIPLKNGEIFPPIPPGGLKSADDLSKVPGVKTFDRNLGMGAIDRVDVEFGMDPETYAYTIASVHRNLFRVPLP
ncbi:MAG TPA: hypothetical protein VFM21_00950, partial [Terriglobia bacterium]|nr:hypothetical protein [Terriglobia bacterium]